MRTTSNFLAGAIILLTIGSCNQAKDQEQKQPAVREHALPQKEKEPATERQHLSTTEAVSLAEQQFAQYLPRILESHDAILDVQQSYTGDFTGDGVADVAIYFSLAPRGGGNALVGQGLTLYKNEGTAVRVIAGYEPDYLFNVDKISNGRIHVEKLAYAEDDGRCCPSIKTAHTLTIRGSKAY